MRLYDPVTHEWGGVIGEVPIKPLNIEFGVLLGISKPVLSLIKTIGKALVEPKVDNSVVRNGFGGRGKGERGRTAKAEGTDNPFKKFKPDPNDPTKVNYKDVNGNTKTKPKPEGFDEYWLLKHPPKK